MIKRLAAIIAMMMFLSCCATVFAEEVTFSSLVEGLKSKSQEMADDTNNTDEKSVYNLLLIGADRRDASWNGNSDCILLVSINKESKSIRLMSFMRDLGVNVPGRGINKINYSHAVGGADLLIETLGENFGVQIDNYARADFMDLAELVDELGGMTLELSDAEVQWVNEYTNSICAGAGIAAPDPIPCGGTYHCKGVQVVGYARVRYVGNDYQRTERQRTIISNIKEQVKELDEIRLAAFAAKALAVVDHDLDFTAIASLTAQLKEILEYEIETSRVPFDGHFYSDHEKLMPEQPYTREQIQEFLK